MEKVNERLVSWGSKKVVQRQNKPFQRKQNPEITRRKEITRETRGRVVAVYAVN